MRTLGTKSGLVLLALGAIVALAPAAAQADVYRVAHCTAWSDLHGFLYTETDSSFVPNNSCPKIGTRLEGGTVEYGDLGASTLSVGSGEAIRGVEYDYQGKYEQGVCPWIQYYNGTWNHWRDCVTRTSWTASGHNGSTTTTKMRAVLGCLWATCSGSYANVWMTSIYVHADDRVNPTNSAQSGTLLSGGYKRGTGFSVSWQGNDSQSGIERMRARVNGSQIHYERGNGTGFTCSGINYTYFIALATNSTMPAPCPSSNTASKSAIDTDAAPFTEGANTLTLHSFDVDTENTTNYGSDLGQEGNEATSTYTVNVDNSPPNTPTISGCSSAWQNTNASCTLSATDVGGAGITANGLRYRQRSNGDAWPASYTSLANGGSVEISEEGVTDIQRYAIDNAKNKDGVVGNVSALPVALGAVNIDKTDPHVDLTCGEAPTAAGSSTCEVSGTDPINQSNGSTGSGVAGSEYRIRAAGADWSPWNAIAPGDTFEVTLESDHHLEGRVRDEAGNEATDMESVGQPPGTDITSAPNALVASASAELAFSSPQVGVSYECKLDSQDWVACTSPARYDDLQGGHHHFEVRARSGVGVPDATPASHSWEIDVTPPNLAIDGGMAEGAARSISGSEVQLAASATDAGAGVSSLTLDIDGVRVDTMEQDCDAGACPFEADLWPADAEVAEGLHDFAVVARDRAGNLSTESGTFTVDPKAPTLDISGPLDQSAGTPLQGTEAELYINAVDENSHDSGIAALDLTIDGVVALHNVPNCEPACPSQANSTFHYSTAEWGAGPHELVVTAIDEAGNTMVAPPLEIDPPANTPTALCPDVTADLQPANEIATVSEARADAFPAATAPSIPTYSELTETDVDPALSASHEWSPDTLDAEGTVQESAILTTGAGGVALEDTVCLTPMQTTTAAEPPQVVAGDTAIAPNTATDTDTITRPTPAGATIVENLRGPEAPDAFSWKVGLPSGTELVELADGGVAVVDPSLPADSELWAPPAPTGENDPEMIADAETQLDAALHQTASAELETAGQVAALFPAPYSVDSGGAVRPARLEVAAPDVITMRAADGAGPDQALVLRVIRSPAFCKYWFPLEYFQLGVLAGQYSIQSIICLVKHKNGVFAKFEAEPAHGFVGRAGGRFRIVLLKWGHLHDKSREALRPIVPFHLRTTAYHRYAWWCARFQIHTKNARGQIVWTKNGQESCRVMYDGF